MTALFIALGTAGVLLAVVILMARSAGKAAERALTSQAELDAAKRIRDADSPRSRDELAERLRDGRKL